jgi:hypothetical protein
VLCIAAMIAASACGNTVSGTAASQKSDSSSSSSASSSPKPDPGNYPTTPRPPLGAAGTPLKGSLLDAQRMAGYVTGPWEVDPGLIEAFPPQALVIKNADAVGVFLDKDVSPVAGKHNFVNGFHTARQLTGQRSLRNAVLRFSDPAEAAAAATEMAQVQMAQPVSGATRTAVPVPGHADALTSSYPFTDTDSHHERANITSFTPHGPFVLVQIAQSFNGLDEAVGLVGKTLDLQIPLIDQFTPTAVADFPSVPVDPSGLLARTIPVSGKDETVNSNATYDRRGQEQFQSDPVKSAQLFGDTGMDVSTSAKTTVYQATDGAAASKIVDEFAAEVSATGKPDDPVTGVPGSTCINLSSSGIYCVAPAGRYAIEASSGQRDDVHQLLAAQYLMLTAT